MTKPSNIVISTVLRNQRYRGATSSAQQNDMQAEIIRDLTALQQQWNNLLVPAFADVPDGTVDSNINAFTNGLDGQTLLTNADATSNLSNGQYYNDINGRPNTLYEQFQNVYTTITNNVTTLEDAILALGGGTDLSTVTTDLQQQIDTNEASIAGVVTSSTHRRLQVTISSLADTASVALVHNANMYPHVQIITQDALATAGYAAGEILPPFDPNVTSAAGVTLVHNDVNQVTLTNNLGETLVNGFAIISW